MNWRPIPTHPQYSISDTGLIRGPRKMRRPQDHPSTDGYLKVHLTKPDKFITIHRLVALTFVPNPDSKVEVNHKNGDRQDNRAENLEWVTHGENMRHATDALGRYQGTKNPQHKLSEDAVREIRRLVAMCWPIKWIAHQYSIHECSVRAIISGKKWGSLIP